MSIGSSSGMSLLNLDDSVFVEVEQLRKVQAFELKGNCFEDRSMNPVL